MPETGLATMEQIPIPATRARVTKSLPLSDARRSCCQDHPGQDHRHQL